MPVGVGRLWTVVGDVLLCCLAGRSQRTVPLLLLLMRIDTGAWSVRERVGGVLGVVPVLL